MVSNINNTHYTHLLSLEIIMYLATYVYFQFHVRFDRIIIAAYRNNENDDTKRLTRELHNRLIYLLLFDASLWTMTTGIGTTNKHNN